jgi:hypothetical protein
MLSRKIALLLMIYGSFVFGRDVSTLLVHFHVAHDDLPRMAKTFVNKTKHPVRIRWRLMDRQTREFIGQEPIVMRGDLMTIEIEGFLTQFDKAAGLLGYDFSLEVARVLNFPKQKGDGIQVCRFKNGPSDLQINKKSFLETTGFELRQNKQNILSCCSVANSNFD